MNELRQLFGWKQKGYILKGMTFLWMVSRTPSLWSFMAFGGERKSLTIKAILWLFMSQCWRHCWCDNCDTKSFNMIMVARSLGSFVCSPVHSLSQSASQPAIVKGSPFISPFMLLNMKWRKSLLRQVLKRNNIIPFLWTGFRTGHNKVIKILWTVTVLWCFWVFSCHSILFY